MHNTTGSLEKIQSKKDAQNDQNMISTDFYRWKLPLLAAERAAHISISTIKITNRFKWSDILGVELGFVRDHTSPEADILFLLSEIQMYVLKYSLLWSVLK